MNALQPGDPSRVGKYLLLNRLGTGGMGRVYLGQSPGGRMVAVKLIRAELADDPDFRRRFAQEVAAARRVSGMFTAPVLDADPDGPQPWLVTSYVGGPSLADAVGEFGPLPVESVLMLAAGLAAGLGTVHAAGIVHRDLKPSNVLLAADGPRIIDFGISRAVDSTWLTYAGGVIGSPGFMSPEQAEGREVGPPTDIFSLGGVLAFAASGRPPFGAGSASALLYRVVYGSAALGHVPLELRPLIERCLAKNPVERPTTDQLLSELGNTTQLAKGWLSRHIQLSPASAGRRPTGLARLQLHNPRQAERDTVADRTRPTRRSPTWHGPAWHGPASGSRALGGRAMGSRGWGSRALGSRAWRGRALGSRAWRGRAGVIGWTATAALAAGAASAVAVAAAADHHASAGRPSANDVPVPNANKREQVQVPTGPRSVVLDYFAAINARDWARVWRLGGDRLAPSYHTMVAGYAGTVRDDVQSVRVTGDRALVTIEAKETGGTQQVFLVEYTVRNGIIISARWLHR